MANTYLYSRTPYGENSKAQTLTRFLKRINQCDNSELLRKEANQLLTNICPNDIATAEQNLINDGYSAQAVQLLSATFMLMGIPQEQSSDIKAQLPANHLLLLVMAEHDLIRYFLADLNDVVECIGSVNHLTDVSMEFCKLTHIVEHLNAMKEHIEREEDVIFPYLRRYGRISLCQAMQGDHVKIRTEINNLVSLIMSFNNVTLEQFKAGLVTTTDRLCTIMHEHLSQEDIILYPIALGIINNARIWQEIKALCDEMGYCGVHL